MLISRELIEASEVALKKAKFEPAKLERALGDGPIEVSAEHKRHRHQQLLGEVGTVERANVVLERIIQGNDLVGINYLAKGTLAARSVCRIQLRDAAGNALGFGSGLLVAPGVLMTNHHVFATAADARHSIADFDFELDVAGRDRTSIHFAFEPSRLFYANKELDFAIVAVQPRSMDGARELKDWGWLALDGRPGKSDPGEYLTIIQHPAGERKQVCVRENKLLKFDGDVMWYATDTVGGSSGSPVFNRFWQVVALHHSGVPKKDSKGRWLTTDGRVWDESMDERLIDWIANEGIRVSSIVRHLNFEASAHPLVKLVLESGWRSFDRRDVDLERPRVQRPRVQWSRVQRPRADQPHGRLVRAERRPRVHCRAVTCADRCRASGTGRACRGAATSGASSGGWSARRRAAAWTASPSRP